MRWESYEDKINLFLQRKWDRFSDYVLKTYTKILKFSLKKANELTQVDFKGLYLELKDSFYRFVHYIQEQSKVIPQKVRSKLSDINTNPKIQYSILAVASFIYFANESYLRYREIFPKEYPKRSLSSEQINKRPAYYNKEKKLIKIYNINIPILTDENKKTKSILVDLNVQLSSRYSKAVLESLHHELNDYLNTNTSPIVKDFPLTPEGKEILREKIHQILQDLLIKKGLQAKVEKVFIASILSS